MNNNIPFFEKGWMFVHKVKDNSGLAPDRIERDEQVILLLNRRGYSNYLNCQSCGHVFKCPNCDITLTYHKTSNNFVARLLI
mgnify:CR=1 FL=1